MLAAVLCTFCFITSQARLVNVLSLEEEECIQETGITRNLVIQDKTSYPTKGHIRSNPALNDYLGCYARKLSSAGKIVFTRNMFISLPGYKTKYEIKSLWCNEDDSSQNEVPCILKL